MPHTFTRPSCSAPRVCTAFVVAATVLAGGPAFAAEAEPDGRAQLMSAVNDLIWGGAMAPVVARATKHLEIDGPITARLHFGLGVQSLVASGKTRRGETVTVSIWTPGTRDLLGARMSQLTMIATTPSRRTIDILEPHFSGHNRKLQIRRGSEWHTIGTLFRQIGPRGHGREPFRRVRPARESEALAR